MDYFARHCAHQPPASVTGKQESYITRPSLNPDRNGTGGLKRHTPLAPASSPLLNGSQARQLSQFSAMGGPYHAARSGEAL